MNKALLLVVVLSVFALCACVSVDVHLSGNEDPIAQAVRAAMDFSVNPCDDFYQFACGTWIKNTTLPDDIGRLVKSFDVVTKKVRFSTLDLL
jgi:predicted metalloendopeptidase